MTRWNNADLDGPGPSLVPDRNQRSRRLRRGGNAVHQSKDVDRSTVRDLATRSQRERRGGWKIEEGWQAGRATESSGQRRVERTSSSPVGPATHAQGSANTENRRIGVEAGEGADFPEHCGPEQGFGLAGRVGVIRDPLRSSA